MKYISKKKLFYWGAGLITFVLLEFYFHVFEYQTLTFVQRAPIYQEDSIIRYKYLPNQRIFRDNGIFKTNKQGYLGDDFDLTSNKYRIAIVGSSGVAGSITDKNYYAYPQILQKIFNENNFQDIEILNCGIDGAQRSYDNFMSIENNVLKFSPNLILFEIDMPFIRSNCIRTCYRNYTITCPVQEKIFYQQKLKTMVDNIYNYDWFLNIVFKSYMVRAICKVVSDYIHWEFLDSYREYLWLYWNKILEYAQEKYYQKYTLEDSAQMINELKSKLRKQNVGFYVLNYEKKSPAIDLAKNYKFPLLSLEIEFEDDDYFNGHGHWNEQGQSRVADSLFVRLIRFDLLKTY